MRQLTAWSRDLRVTADGEGSWRWPVRSGRMMADRSSLRPGCRQILARWGSPRCMTEAGRSPMRRSGPSAAAGPGRRGGATRPAAAVRSGGFGRGRGVVGPFGVGLTGDHEPVPSVVGFGDRPPPLICAVASRYTPWRRRSASSTYLGADRACGDRRSGQGALRPAAAGNVSCSSYIHRATGSNGASLDVRRAQILVPTLSTGMGPARTRPKRGTAPGPAEAFGSTAWPTALAAEPFGV